MTRLNGRVSRLEEIAPAPAEDDNDLEWLRELCADVLRAIDSGEIVTMAERGPLVEGFYHDETDYRPTEAGHLAGDERSRVYSLLYRADKIVSDFARVTDWRSPGGDPNRPYTFYHANSVSELRDVMQMVLDATTQS